MKKKESLSVAVPSAVSSTKDWTKTPLQGHELGMVVRLLRNEDVKSELSPYKLSTVKVKGLTPSEAILFQILREELETDRERLRNAAISESEGQDPKAGDYVDYLDWEELFYDESVYLKVATRAKLLVTDVVQFAYRKCEPKNVKAMIYLWAYEEMKKISLTAQTNNASVVANLKSNHEKQLIQVAKDALSKKAKESAQHRYSEDTKDKKQLAKKEVKDCWDKWQRKPSSYKSKSAFARGMLEKYEVLENQLVIVSWCTKWEKEAATLHLK